jgi:uncharacterized Zn finger protein
MARRRSTYYTDESWGYERTSPIRTDQGIKSRSQRGNFAASWWADRWIKALERLVDAGRLSRGRSYARKGQVLEIKEKKGQIEAKVQGSRPTPYKVTIRLDPLTDAQWQGVFAALAAQAIFSAQLLNGEMPQTIEEVFAAAGVSLFPTQSGELHTDCSCPDWANPCKHVAAVHYILGEQFDEDPFLLFVLRGRTQEQVLAALRAQRRVEAGAGALAEAPGEYQAEAASPPLDALLEQFWHWDESLEHFPLFIQPPAPTLPVLKRLGQPAFVARTLESMLGPAYTAVTKAALDDDNLRREEGEQHD